MNHQKLPPILEPGDRLGGAIITGYGGCHHPYIIDAFEYLEESGIEMEQVSFTDSGFRLICKTREDAGDARNDLLGAYSEVVPWAEFGVYENTGRGWVEGSLSVSPWYGNAQTIAWIKSMNPQTEPAVEPISSFKSSADSSTQTTQMVYTIPIIERQNNVPVVQVTINGYQCEMLLDTGCSLMSLSRDVVKAIRPRQIGTATASTASGQHQTKIYELATVQAGNLTVKNVQASALKNGDRGLLGHSFWGNQHITIKSDVVEIGESTNPQAENQSRNLQEDDEMPNRTTDQRRRAVKVKRRVAPTSANYTPKPPKDDYSDRQEAIHKGTAKAASYLHLAGGAFLGVAQTCFRRTFLSFVAAFALIGGMILASIGYAISLGFMPQQLFPDNQSIGQLYQGLVQWLGTAQPWQLWGCAIAAFLAVVVQCFQSWSIYTIQNGVAASKAGGKSIFSNRLHRFLFYVVAGLVWYLDFETISGVSFAAGVAGFALWLWAAFPSEIAAMILQIQKASKDD